MILQALYTHKSQNSKTGNIPQQVIGTNVDETRSSCQGCPMLASNDCYAHKGTVSWGMKSTQRSYANGKDKSLDHALAKRSKKAKYVRFGEIGDPSALGKQYFDDEAKIRASGLGVLAYTHFWQKGNKGEHLRGHAMASCESVNQAVSAVKSGWRAAVHVPKDHWMIKQGQGKTESGIRFTHCPNTRFKGSRTIQCNDCGLCDAAKPAVDIIVLTDI